MNNGMFQMVECEVTKKVDDGLEVELKPSGLSGIIPKLHLSDHHSNCSLLHDIAKVGDVFKQAMYLASGTSIVSLTMGDVCGIVIATITIHDPAYATTCEPLCHSVETLRTH